MRFISIRDGERAIGKDPSVVEADRTRITEAVIEAACRAVENEIGRYVRSRACLETYDGNGTSILLLHHPPAVVTDVREDAARAFDTGTIIPAAEYVVRPSGEDGGTGGRMIELLDGRTFAEGVATIQVTYVGGWTFAESGTPVETDWATTTIPRDLYTAALLTVKSMWGKIGAGGVTGGNGLLGLQALTLPGGGNLTLPSSLFDAMPPEAKALCAPYRWNVRGRVW